MTTLETVVVVIGVLIASILTVLVLATVLITVTKWRDDRQRKDARQTVRMVMLERSARDDPEWKKWVRGLSKVERSELESVLDRYLRTLKGQSREPFLGLASALELGERADGTLETGSVPRRLHALSTLALLDYHVPEERLFETCTDDDRVREAAARVVYERRKSYDDPSETGTELLLTGRENPLTIHGMSTLYRLNNHGRTPLLFLAETHSSKQTESLFIQLCQVLGHCQITDSDVSMGWVFPLLEHETPAVRASALRVFKQHGWRQSVRESVPYRTLVTDPSLEVRQAVYETLTYWGDEESKQLLEWAVVDEDDPRAQLLALRGLLSMGADPETDYPGWPEKSWRWIEAELAVDRSKALTTRASTGVGA